MSVGNLVRRHVASAFRHLIGRAVQHTSSSVVLEAVERRRLLTAISGVVFDDVNRNDRFDAGESGVTNAVVFADYNYNGALDAAEPRTNVPSGGSYSLTTDARPFALVVQPPANYEQVGPYNSARPYFFNGSETTVTNRNFVLASPATATLTSVSGVVFDDYDHNGVQTANESSPNWEPELAGRTAFADLNDNGQLDAGEPSTVTKAIDTGLISYRLLVPHSAFTVRVVPTPGYVVSLVGGVAGYRFDTRPNAPVAIYRDLGLYGAGDFVSGAVFIDNNKYSIFEPGEEAGAGHRIFVDLDRDGVQDPNETESTVTAADGSYVLRFNRALDAGPDDAVKFGFIPAAGYAAPFPGFLLGAIQPPPVTPLHGQFNQLVTRDTTTPTQTISTSVLFDSNQNGRADPGEGYAAGQTVFADYNYNGVLDAGEPSAVSDSEGTASLTVAIRPFALRLKPASGYTQTAPANNGVFYYEVRNGSLVGNEGQFHVAPNMPVSTGTVNVGATYEDGNGNGHLDRGEAIVGQDVWIDANQNFVHDPNEISIPYYNRSGLGQGPYDGNETGFITLPLGTYRFAVSVINTLGAQSVRTNTVTISSPGQVININFPVPAARSRVEGYVFLDADRDGVRDADERNGGYGSASGAATVWADYDNDGIIDAGEPTISAFASDGFYSILVDDNRSFTLTLKTPDGYVQTSPSGGGGRGIFFNSIGVVSNQNFGVAPKPTPTTSSLTTHVYIDTNNDGTIEASEAVASNGVGGQQVFADYNYNGVIDVGEAVVPTDATGTATLSVKNQPFALRMTTTNRVTQSAPANNGVYFYELRNGVPLGYGSTFGVAPTPAPPAGSSTITVDYFADDDGDGQRGTGDPAYPVPADGPFIDNNRNETFDAGDRAISSFQYTGGGVGYYFGDLAAGTYHIVLSRGLAAGESITGGGTRDVTIGNGQSTELAVPITGYKYVELRLDAFFDDNHNGSHETAEATVQAGTEVGGSLIFFVDLNYNGILDANEPTTFPQNHYGFGPSFALLPGGYSVRAVTNDGKSASLAYGSPSRWIVLPKAGVYETTFGITQIA